MSDFRYTATCPGCGRRFAPDDGACCVQCDRCKQWYGDSHPHDIPRDTIPAAEFKRVTQFGLQCPATPRTQWVCPYCKEPGDVDAEEYYDEREAIERGKRAPDTLELQPGSTKVQPHRERRAYVKGDRR
jgi:hypothetical protein